MSSCSFVQLIFDGAVSWVKEKVTVVGIKLLITFAEVVIQPVLDAFDNEKVS